MNRRTRHLHQLGRRVPLRRRTRRGASKLWAFLPIAAAVGWIVADTANGGRVFEFRRQLDSLAQEVVTYSVDATSGLERAADRLSADLRLSDGDTLRLDGERIRLWGVDAPELHQRCNGVAIGEVAKDHLAALIGRGVPDCARVETDRYGRTVARCSVAGSSLAEQMVTEGWAWDYTRYSGGAYASAEAQAREKRLGIWAIASCEPPWEWRARN